MILQEILLSLTHQFADVSDTPKLDAELLIAHVLGKTRAEILTHPDTDVESEQYQYLKKLAEKRMQGEPMAYLLGRQEFWSLSLMVNSSVLIPRPETEDLVEWTLNHFSERDELMLADLGTGSGAIALAIASEKSCWKISATDFSEAALNVARYNASKYQLNNIHFYQGNWCDALPSKRYDVLISNPPYIPEQDQHLKNLRHEPRAALVAGVDGLDAIRSIIQQAPAYLKEQGCLVLEHGYNQATSVRNLLQERGFVFIETYLDLAGCDRFTVGKIR